ncbi:MAG: 50S ribosomal protein L4 [Bacteroidetes bacterium RIFOXYA12_FULL_35_11]|nr:MAG: 50S ribosomal protein L4 [Bacteroidetes bacterium GWF2_35_48]OFY79598.1 MAG: 50S ribosomal protein L4 [Bacteroidetes bacterium RIFOXYA12_FULL_35_11]OFY96071.1 MAG: 50S ribosomal protein L4 [Bacteroidetes bacterium RIFOXYB2_FULL_35_7]OFY99410.1 MAG: 50S ribosomal protein L4 [Bacteroidetes bacterium RIFOXYC12_FULL_35_7]HBX50549.1 50S ribosomal protein L4 [Bacteroidales bacterium]
MELTVLNKSGEDTGKRVELNDTVFGIEPNDHAMYLDVKQYMANNRQGTHKTKDRSEISASTRKIKRQKGTGGARAGSIKSGVFVGGGRVFGPKPRDYSFKLNKKVKQLARKTALSYKAKENKIIIIEDFNLDQPKTKEMISMKNNLKINDKKLLFVISEPNNNIYLSSRNLEYYKVVTASELSTYDILNSSTLLLAESSINVIEKTFGIK